MNGGAESAIIEEWKKASMRLIADERDRADLGSITLTFATLAECRSAWQKALRGWNMQTSPFLDEIRAQGLEEGLERGRLEGVRTTLMKQGRQKFGKPPSKKQQKELEGISDPTHLDSLAERLLTVDSWVELLADV
jgi:predicted transposase YdaD